MSNDHEELDELEPIADAPSPDPAAGPAEGAPAQGPSAEQMQAHSVGLLNKLVERSFSGMACPLFNPNASKEYYRFFFGGLLIVLGCLMPFDQDWSHVGYGTFHGAIMLLIGLGICWSMWGAINTGLVRMKWILLAIFPFLYGVLFMISPFPQAEADGRTEYGIMQEYYDAEDEQMTERRHNELLEQVADLRELDPRCNSWGEFGATLGKATNNPSLVGNAIQQSGPGKWLVFLGSLLIEFTFIMSIFGGAKKMKEQKAARGAASRRR